MWRMFRSTGGLSLANFWIFPSGDRTLKSLGPSVPDFWPAVLYFPRFASRKILAKRMNRIIALLLSVSVIADPAAAAFQSLGHPVPRSSLASRVLVSQQAVTE